MSRNKVIDVLRQGSTTPLSFTQVSSVLNSLRESSPLAREEVQILLKSVRLSLPLMNPVELVNLFKPVSDLPREVILPIAADVFTEMLERQLPTNLSPMDAVRLVSICGKMRLYDSDVLEKIFPLIKDVVDMASIRQVVIACNHVRFCFKQSNDLYNAIVGDIGTLTIPLLRYIARDVATNPRRIAPQTIQRCIEAFSKRIEAVKQNEEMVKQRAFVSTDDCVKFVVALGQISRFGGPQIQPLLTPGVCQDIQLVLTRIVAYDLRNLDLNRLLKLFFSLGQLEVFDDFFVRRRLVPAIAMSYRDLPKKTPKDILLVATALSQLPFKVALVHDLVQLLAADAEEIVKDHESLENVRALLEKLNSK